MVILFNVTMWGCNVNSLKALSSLQATVTNFAANFISSGLAGYFLFQEPLPSKVICQFFIFCNSRLAVVYAEEALHFTCVGLWFLSIYPLSKVY
jgi:hypothetical protein